MSDTNTKNDKQLPSGKLLDAASCSARKFLTTSKEREESFRKELEVLLKRHQAEITAESDVSGYHVHPPHIEVTMDGVYNDDGDVIYEYAEFRI